jgi:hypothetical protein
LLTHAWGFNGEDVGAEGRQQETHIFEERLHVGCVSLWQPAPNGGRPVHEFGTPRPAYFVNEACFQPADMRLR